MCFLKAAFPNFSSNFTGRYIEPHQRSQTQKKKKSTMRKVVQEGTGRSTDEKRSRSLQVFNSTQLIHLQSEKRDGASRPTRGDAAGAFTAVGSPKPAGLTQPARSHVSESAPSSLC